MTEFASRPRLGRLHVITDEVLQTRYSHAEVAELALAGGADAIQYREKRALLTRELVANAGAIAEACRSAGATSIIDDRADVAAAVSASGIHLGRDDLEVGAARRLLGDGFLIGGTANSIEEARRVFATPVDYVGIGPVFGTASKANPAPVMGLETLAAICAESPVPVIAIGSITVATVEAVLDTGAYGIAVLSGITCAPNPTAAARDYAERIRAWRSRKGAV
jgi:thiamine-phosphate pyrophosphorylase